MFWVYSILTIVVKGEYYYLCLEVKRMSEFKESKFLCKVII